LATIANVKPRTLILRTAGTNCDAETAHAFELAGAETTFLHVNRLIESPRQLADFQLLAVPGGFSYGDDISAGKIFATQIQSKLRDAFHDFVAARKPVIGVCNGFQVLVKTDLLPGPLADQTGQTCTLAHNDCGRFVDRWIHLAPRSRKCIWTRDLAPAPIALPIAHGEGMFVAGSEAVRRALWANDQVALVYTQPDGATAQGREPHNPNGSVDDIAGVCDATGLVFGLMPHPERHVSPLQHPAWTSRTPLPPEGDGLQIFRSAVKFVS
jgi:phosphoribosylformylglycinamidine synthase